MAYNLIGSEKVRTALDLNREPRPLRESYGMTIFGQAALTARRIVEAGSRFVSVFWDEYGLAGSAWDTHWDHFPRMKQELMPGFDLALSGLIADLDARGMLDETLVLCLSEHGRTPKLANVKGGGRDHWSRAYCGLLAGAGVARGKIVGKTDKIAGDVIERAVSPKDILATVYHLLGIDPETTLTDRAGRPMPLVSDGRVIADVLA
jgi:arylsulfatase A-like enzyme